MNIEEIKDRVNLTKNAFHKLGIEGQVNINVMLNDIEFLLKEIEELKQELEKEKEKNKETYRKANNYLYFNDSANYEVALWEVIRTLRPDLAEKWDNGEYAELKYIEEE